MHLFLLDRRFISEIPAAAIFVSYTSTSADFPGRATRSSWFLLKDAGVPEENWFSPRGNYSRPRTFTDGIYFPYTVNYWYVFKKNPTSLTLSLFLFKYYAILNMSNGGINVYKFWNVLLLPRVFWELPATRFQYPEYELKKGTHPTVQKGHRFQQFCKT